MKKFLNCLLIFLLCGIPLVLQGNEKEEAKPVVIIGSGVGALTSAVYLQRAGVNTLVVEGENPGGAIAQSPNVQNWPGETDINGQVLVEKIRKQAEENGAQFVSKEVVSVDFNQDPLSITMRDVYDHEKIETIKAKACIIAMGSNPKLLGVPGESGDGGYWTKGVYSCAVCDGALYRGKSVAVIGGGDSAILEADYLSKIAKKVYVVLRSDQFRTVETMRKDELIKKDNVEVLYNTKIEEIQGNGQKVTHLNLSTKNDLSIDGVFVAIGATPNSGIFSNQIDLDDNGYIKIKDGQETSARGVFAIGDVVDPIYKQAISAAGDGAKAALQVERYLSTKESNTKVESAAPTIKTIANELPQLSDTKDFYNAIGNQDTPLLVEFYSPSCGPCRQLLPEIEKAATTHKGEIRFLQVDVTQFSSLASTYNVYGVPSVLIFDKQGKLTKRASGFDEIQKILKELDKYAVK
ncbi:MAG: FAD-dependent oxidoreductase [Simkaniaceae bacterium]|nr:FAD-dependent oxidoreductase [Candidatus Sacchlamyda saccharinae]